MAGDLHQIRSRISSAIRSQRRSIARVMRRTERRPANRAIKGQAHSPLDASLAAPGHIQGEYGGSRPMRILGGYLVIVSATELEINPRDLASIDVALRELTDPYTRIHFSQFGEDVILWSLLQTFGLLEKRGFM